MANEEIQKSLDWFTMKANALKAKGKPILFDFAKPVQRCDKCDYPFGLHSMESLEKLRRCIEHNPGGKHAA